MTFSEQLLEVRDHSGPGYLPVVDYGRWRVAVLNFSPNLLPAALTRMQRHDETDEVFVLLRGRCMLFIGEGRQAISRIHAVEMAPLTIYNVKKAVWHTHALSRDAMVLVVENRDTTYDNSPFCMLGGALHNELVQLAGDIGSE